MTYDLFLYLIENYSKKGKVKYTNIYYFLMDLVKQREGLLFNFSQKEYSAFIEDQFNVKLKKYKKADFAYGDKEVPVLKSCTATFIERYQKA